MSKLDPFRALSLTRPGEHRQRTADAYAAALGGAAVRVCCADGRCEALDSARWLGPARGADLLLLDWARGPVLDVGCGPGRLVTALTSRGIPALGVDIDVAAVGLTRAAGSLALRRCVFEPLPAEGRWRSVLLADGNIGIGGDPVRLLRRVRNLLAPDGRVLVELSASGGVEAGAVRLEHAGVVGPWFRWARVGSDAVHEVAQAAGLTVTQTWSAAEWGSSGPTDRWFAVLAPGPPEDVTAS